MAETRNRPPYLLIIITVVALAVCLPYIIKSDEELSENATEVRFKKTEANKEVNYAPSYYERSGETRKRNVIPEDLEPEIPPGAIEDELILSFNNLDDLNAFLIAAVENGIEILGENSQLKAIRIRTGDKDTRSMISKLADKYAQEDYNYTVQIPRPPKSDPTIGQEQLVPFENHALQWLGIDGNNDNWGDGITVAVLDTGIDSHSAFESTFIQNIDLTEGGEGIEDSASGHGTAVASIIGGKHEITQGVAPAANLLGITVLEDDGTGNHFTVASGIIEAVDRGANIINISLGSQAHSPLLLDAINYAADNNVTIVAAVGNDNSEHVSFPAAYESVIAVSAIDANGNYASFSNSGPTVDIAAPGIGIFSAGPDNNIAQMSGTSFAAPYVAGTIAALLSENPGMTNAEAVNLIMQYSDEAGYPEHDNEFGNGILNIDRILNRDTEGIYDVALADIFVPHFQPNGDSPPSFWVSVQNRGTEWLGNLNLTVSQNGSLKVLNVDALNPGQVYSQLVEINQDFKNFEAGNVTIEGEVTINGVEDSKEHNNSRTKDYTFYSLQD